MKKKKKLVVPLTLLASVAQELDTYYIYRTFIKGYPATMNIIGPGRGDSLHSLYEVQNRKDLNRNWQKSLAAVLSFLFNDKWYILTFCGFSSLFFFSFLFLLLFVYLLGRSLPIGYSLGNINEPICADFFRNQGANAWLHAWHRFKNNNENIWLDCLVIYFYICEWTDDTFVQIIWYGWNSYIIIPFHIYFYL